MAKCLVTGGCGFIGSHLVDELINLGHEVLVIDDLSTGNLNNLNQEAEFLEADIYNELTWNLDHYDYVFHMASLARIQPSIEDPIAAHQVNVDGTLQVLEYCRHNKAKLIFSSSSSIYAGEALPTDELAPKKPKSPYALQKLIAEQYIRIYRELYGLEYTILRYFNVYGERQILDGAYAAVVGIFLDQRARHQKLTITNDGEQRRDFTYVKDIARANILAMKLKGTFNAGTGENYSVNEIAKAVDHRIKYIPARPGEVRETLADSSKLQGEGWLPTVNILDWIKNASVS